MARDPDDDAFTWAGDADRVGSRPARESAGTSDAAGDTVELSPASTDPVSTGGASTDPTSPDSTPPDSTPTGSTPTGSTSTGSTQTDPAPTDSASTDSAEPGSPRDGSAAAPRSRREIAVIAGYGVLGGVYLVYTVLWILGVQQVELVPESIFHRFMFQFGEFLAIIASALWFAAAWILTRGDTPGTRLLWLLAGAVVLVPWPFLVAVMA